MNTPYIAYHVLFTNFVQPSPLILSPLIFNPTALSFSAVFFLTFLAQLVTATFDAFALLILRIYTCQAFGTLVLEGSCCLHYATSCQVY